MVSDSASSNVAAWPNKVFITESAEDVEEFGIEEEEDEEDVVRYSSDVIMLVGYTIKTRKKSARHVSCIVWLIFLKQLNILSNLSNREVR